jgi:hypothetical protein
LHGCKCLSLHTRQSVLPPFDPQSAIPNHVTLDSIQGRNRRVLRPRNWLCSSRGSPTASQDEPHPSIHPPPACSPDGRMVQSCYHNSFSALYLAPSNPVDWLCFARSAIWLPAAGLFEIGFVSHTRPRLSLRSPPTCSPIPQSEIRNQQSAIPPMNWLCFARSALGCLSAAPYCPSRENWLCFAWPQMLVVAHAPERSPTLQSAVRNPQSSIPGPPPQTCARGGGERQWPQSSELPVRLGFRAYDLGLAVLPSFAIQFSQNNTSL